jgi:pectate lyase
MKQTNYIEEFMKRIAEPVRNDKIFPEKRHFPFPGTFSFGMLLLIFIFCVLIPSHAQVSAFPGAEGHGRYATGGRGGAVYYVTHLEDNTGPGSLRYAITRSGARTIVFAVSGTIVLNSDLKITNGNLTIAGQSAPGDGICISGYPVVVDANNVIIRYLRFRMGDERNVNADGADAFGGRKRNNIIIDHCSVSWSTDECCSFYENSLFTMQWCLISESLNYSAHSKGEHGYGGIWGGMKASFHHNLLAHHKSRVPRLGPGATSTPSNECVDIRNNVYYNYNGEGCYGGEAMHANIVNNYYKPGPANTMNATKKGRIIAIDKKIDNSFPAIEDVWGTFFIDGNIVEGHTNATKDNWTYGVYNQIHSKYGTISQTTKDTIRLATPLPTDVVTTHTAEEAYEQVLLEAGCSLHRDALDTRIIEEVRSNTANYKGVKANRSGIIDSQNDLKPGDAGDDWSPWPALESETPPTDSNQDGIPDGWIERNYPGKSATDLNEESYTYLEVYLNSLVEAQNNGENAIDISLVGQNNAEIKLYVDSSAKTLKIEVGKNTRQIELFNASGIKVYSVSLKKNTAVISLSAFPTGIYMLKTLGEDSFSSHAIKLKI